MARCHVICSIATKIRKSTFWQRKNNYVSRAFISIHRKVLLQLNIIGIDLMENKFFPFVL